VLWSRSFTPAASQLASSAASPVNSLIRDALIEGKTTEEHYEKDGYAVRWTFFNELELIFVVRPTPLSGVSCDQTYPTTLLVSLGH
jgi:signal recognition particle receptor subunit alpha